MKKKPKAEKEDHGENAVPPEDPKEGREMKEVDAVSETTGASRGAQNERRVQGE